MNPLLAECRSALELAFSDGTPKRAGQVALVVGTLLVLINQYEALLGHASINWLKFLLTYCVPYLVSTYTSVHKDLQMIKRAGVPCTDADKPSA